MPVAVTAVDAGNPVELVGNVAQIIGDRLVGDVAAGKVEVSNQELRTVRDAMRQLNRMVDDLERGDSEKYVLTRHGQMRAVVVSVEYFAALRRANQPHDTIVAPA